MNAALFKAIAATGVTVFTIIGGLCSLPGNIKDVQTELNKKPESIEQKTSE